jgi:hypothetical protein
MASNITTASLDENYPVAGRDNDTQGFRDNFSIIKSNLNFTKSEIEDLQDKVVLKSPLGNSTLDNNMNGSNIVNVNLQQSSETMYSADIALSQATVSYTNGNYHKYNLTNSSTNYALNLTNWLTVLTGQVNRYSKMTVELLSTDGEKTIEWTSSSSVGGISVIKKTLNWPDNFVVPQSNSLTDYTSVIVEFWTYDGGVTVYANYLGSFV